jgi:hypothetical protein
MKKDFSCYTGIYSATFNKNEFAKRHVMLTTVNEVQTPLQSYFRSVHVTSERHQGFKRAAGTRNTQPLCHQAHSTPGRHAPMAQQATASDAQHVALERRRAKTSAIALSKPKNPVI